MRTAANDHGDLAPSVDVGSHKHTAYIIDAFLYLFKALETAWRSGLVLHIKESKTQSDEEHFPGPLAQQSDSFFCRSDSTLSLAGAGLDPVLTPVSEALPLAVTPQRLQPDSQRSDLFGTAR